MQSTSGISAAGQIYDSEYYRAWDLYYEETRENHEETREDHEGRREEAYRLARSLLLDCGSTLGSTLGSTFYLALPMTVSCPSTTYISPLGEYMHSGKDGQQASKP
jgi:hypothetical protein